MTERAGMGALGSDFTVGDWLVQPSLNRISRDGQTIRLRPQLMNLLACLSGRPAQTVTRDEILAAVWPGQFIAETGLARCIAELRQALGDAAGQDSKYIQTIPKRGYRLIAPVGPAPIAAAAAAPFIATPYPQRAVPPDVVVAPEDGHGAPPSDSARLSRDGDVVAGARPEWWRERRVLVSAICGVALIGAAVFAWRFVGRPALVEHDTVVVAFENTSGDGVFDAALPLALSSQLEQSPALRVVSAQRIHEELGYMNRPADTRVTRAVAVDLCQRVGAKAVVAGSLASLGRQYVIGLEGVACESGETIAREQVEAASKEQVLASLGRAVSSIRERLGESVASIRRFDVPIARATTSSLDALKAFSQGDYARARGEDDDAIRFYRRAIDFDPGFALAHLRLGLQFANLSRYGEAVEQLRHAYAARARASEAERLYITSFYYDRVVRDPIKAAEPLEIWRDTYPKSAIPRFTLASLYGRIGRHEESYVQAKEALRLEPGHALAAVCLIDSLMRLGRLDEAKRLGEEQSARAPASVTVRTVLAQIAFAQGDDAALRRHIDWASTTAAAGPAFLDLESSIARFGGRMQEAARFNGQRIALAEQRGDPILVAVAMLEEASDRARVGQARPAAGLASAALQRSRTPETLARAALVFATAGEADRAEELLREYDSLPDVTPASDPDFRPAAIALITMSRGFPQSAIEMLAPLRPYDLGWRFNFLPAYVRGLALLQMQRPAEAVKEFDRICQNRGAVPETLVYALAWLQRGRAKAAAGDGKGARADYEQFLRFWANADSDLPLLAEVRKDLAGLPR